MDLKKMTPRVSEKAHGFFTDNFRTANAGAEYALEMVSQLYVRAMYDMKGLFSKDELMTMIDVYNGHALTAQMAGQSLWWSVTEGIKYDALDQKWNISKEAMQKKIETLNIFQCACLEIWANGFWYGGDPGKDLDQKSFDKHLAPLLPDPDTEE